MEILEQQAQPTNRPRITTRYMTKYERARILGTRALQIRCAHHWHLAGQEGHALAQRVSAMATTLRKVCVSRTSYV